MSQLKNIYQNLPDDFSKEFFEELLSTKDFKVERIVSNGHASPPEFWFDQDKDEFVILLKGRAGLSYDDGQKFTLKPGDYLIIPAHQKHRVEWTDKNQKTFWLALHF